jgi:hypothetical protein
MAIDGIHTRSGLASIILLVLAISQHIPKVLVHLLRSDSVSRLAIVFLDN